MNRAAFFDRDGTLLKCDIKNGKPIPRSFGVASINGAIELCRYLRDEGYLLFVITNQPDAARGITTKEKIEWENNVLSVAMPIEKIYTCYHDNEDNCECRKPKIGSVLEAKREYDIDLEKSWFIGDRKSDIECGNNAGCKTIFIDYNYKEEKPKSQNYTFKSIKEVDKFFKENNDY
jgi:D-glycero-D-manno-heptose 1,7-bisphosphate phosphatase